MNHWGCFLVFSLKIVTISHRSTYREGRANRSSNPNRLMRHVRVDHLWCHVRLLCVLISITADRRRGDRTAEGEGGNGRTEGHNPWKSQQTPPPRGRHVGIGVCRPTRTNSVASELVDIPSDVFGSRGRRAGVHRHRNRTTVWNRGG